MPKSQSAVRSVFHDGHAKLIEKAFEIAKDGKVHIGLTSDEMLRKSHSVDNYEKRRTCLLQHINEMGNPTGQI